jgi:3-deoxy-D-manno-octulosonate 8-phosphate phosphatase (KDO 8-P phosphatase)
VRDFAHFVTSKAGGTGAVRELCDLILKAQNHYDKLLKQARD